MARQGSFEDPIRKEAQVSKYLGYLLLYTYLDPTFIYHEDIFYYREMAPNLENHYSLL